MYRIILFRVLKGTFPGLKYTDKKIQALRNRFMKLLNVSVLDNFCSFQSFHNCVFDNC